MRTQLSSLQMCCGQAFSELQNTHSAVRKLTSEDCPTTSTLHASRKPQLYLLAPSKSLTIFVSYFCMCSTRSMLLLRSPQPLKYNTPFIVSHFAMRTYCCDVLVPCITVDIAKVYQLTPDARESGEVQTLSAAIIQAPDISPTTSTSDESVFLGL